MLEVVGYNQMSNNLTLAVILPNNSLTLGDSLLAGVPLASGISSLTAFTNTCRTCIEKIRTWLGIIQLQVPFSIIKIGN